MSVWCLTTSPDNFRRTAEAGWEVQGVKSRRERTAREIAVGDKIVYYVTKAMAFGATVSVTGECFEDHEVIWTSKPGEDYPWRVAITPEVVVEDPERWVPAEELLERLAFPRKWPAEHWRLAFQGNIRAWPEADYEVVRAALEDSAGQRG
jgi:predicted RNA-binding protein